MSLSFLLSTDPLQDLKPEEIAAVLSAFVAPDGKSTDEVPAPTTGVLRAREQVHTQEWSRSSPSVPLGSRFTASCICVHAKMCSCLPETRRECVLLYSVSPLGRRDGVRTPGRRTGHRWSGDKVSCMVF